MIGIYAKWNPRAWWLCPQAHEVRLMGASAPLWMAVHQTIRLYCRLPRTFTPAAIYLKDASKTRKRMHSNKRETQLSHRASTQEPNVSYMFLILLFDQPQGARTCLLRYGILLSLFCAGFFQWISALCVGQFPSLFSGCQNVIGGYFPNFLVVASLSF